MTHEIKIQQCYLIHILEGKKKFEIRKNDRDYQVGDIINFFPLEDQNYNCYAGGRQVPLYTITYVLSCNGLQQNHVALGIEPTDFIKE